jgi:type IV secretory pathway ATPase VirB11/archaellum biosynthesis ATPase
MTEVDCWSIEALRHVSSPFVALKNILMQRAALYLIYTTGATTTICLDIHMKLTTIALAIALALPNTLAFAEGALNYSTPAAHPVVRGVRLTRHAVIRPRDISESTPVSVIREPSGSTLTPLAMSRGG